MSAPTAAPRIPRKPAPRFNYEALYPPADLADPLAPLALLRARHPDGASTALPPAFKLGPPPAESAPPPSIRRQTLVALPADDRRAKRAVSVVGPRTLTKADRRKTAVIAPSVPAVPRLPGDEEDWLVVPSDAEARKSMRPIAVDAPPSPMRKAATPVPNVLRKKSSRASLAARMFARAAANEDSGYETGGSSTPSSSATLTPPSSAASSSTAAESSAGPSRSPSPDPIRAPKRKSSIGALKHQSLSADAKRQSLAAARVLAAAYPSPEPSPEPAREPRARRRTISTAATPPRTDSAERGRAPRSRSSERPSLKSMMSVPASVPVPPLPALPKLEADASPLLLRSTSLHRTPPARPTRSHLRSVSSPDALAAAVRAQLALAPPTPPVPSPSPPPPPLDLEEPASALSARYKPHAKSPKPPTRAPTDAPVPALPPVVPLAERTPQVLRARASTLRLSRPRPGTLSECSSPTSPTSPNRRRATPFAARSLVALPSPDPDRTAPPTPAQLAAASRMVVLRENGMPVPFGTLFAEQRTVVLFIRHFWCPASRAHVARLAPALQRANARLLVVGCGDFNLIKSYRGAFRAPLELVVDPSAGQQLYRALGLRALLPPGLHANTKGRVRSAAFVLKTALRAAAHAAPVWGRGGDAAQLGGAFVLGPGPRCAWAHRMGSAEGHADVREVLAAVGGEGVAAWRAKEEDDASEVSDEKKEALSAIADALFAQAR